MLPVLRTLAKNQTRSRLMGPPSEKLPSQFLTSEGRSANPRDCSRLSMLDDCPHCPAQLKKALPLNVLPPVLGIMLNDGAPRSASPSPPAMVTCTSMALFMSYA